MGKGRGQGGCELLAEVENGRPGKKTVRMQFKGAGVWPLKRGKRKQYQLFRGGGSLSPAYACRHDFGAVASNATAAARGQQAGLGQPVPADAARQPGGTGGMPFDTALRRGRLHDDHSPDRLG